MRRGMVRTGLRLKYFYLFIYIYERDSYILDKL